MEEKGDAKVGNNGDAILVLGRVAFDPWAIIFFMMIMIAMMLVMATTSMLTISK